MITGVAGIESGEAFSVGIAAHAQLIRGDDGIGSGLVFGNGKEGTYIDWVTVPMSIHRGA